MKKYDTMKSAIAGGAAGAVNGLFGAGGGMVLVPLLTILTKLKEEQVFPASVSIILPICSVSLITTAAKNGIPIGEAWPFLLGSIPGGMLAAFFSRRLPVKLHHKILGIMILWGGIRYLW